MGKTYFFAKVISLNGFCLEEVKSQNSKFKEAIAGTISRGDTANQRPPPAASAVKTSRKRKQSKSLLFSFRTLSPLLAPLALRENANKAKVSLSLSLFELLALC